MSRADGTGRRDTKRKQRRQRIEGQFIAHKVDMIASPAFRVLLLCERRLLDRLEIEHAAHGGVENAKLICTYGNCEDFGIRLQSIAASIRAVVALGFVEIMREGRAGNGEHRVPTLYRLTYLNTTGKNGVDAIQPTDEWRKIETLDDARRLAKEARAASSKKHSPLYKTHSGATVQNGSESAISHCTKRQYRTTTETAVLSRVLGKAREASPAVANGWPATGHDLDALIERAGSSWREFMRKAGIDGRLKSKFLKSPAINFEHQPKAQIAVGELLERANSLQNQRSNV